MKRIPKINAHRTWLCCSYSTGPSKEVASTNLRSSHQRCSVKKVFLEILQNSQEKTCASVSFLIALQASVGCRLWCRCFCCRLWCRIFRNFQKLLFLQNTSHGCFYKVTHLIFFYNIFTLFQNCLWIVFPHLKNRIW